MRCPCDVMVKASEFKLQLCHYVWTNILGKGMNPLILQGMG